MVNISDMHVRQKGTKMRKNVDYTDIARYDKAFKYVADVVYSDNFMLGNKGDHLRIIVSDYGFNRILKDSLEGMIDVEASSMVIQAFDYPEITKEEIDEELSRQKQLLVETIREWKPLPEELRRQIHEDDSI
ncbi:MAG: hypothetical protein K6E30_06830 [Lachnospiraceae bacterium]|nr:hypothetical protein [Lachnospiraceae bacterium]